MKIGILVTNTDESAFANRHPKDGEKFRTLLQPLRPDWRFTAVQVKDGEFPDSAEAFDGYVITGSPASANGDDPWVLRLLDFIRDIDQQKIPTVGVCFGHQAIARALGGTVAKNPGGWGFGIAQTHFTAAEPWMTPWHESLSLYAAHSEQVMQVPPGAVVLGGSDFCPVGSYKVGAHIFTTEYHPEMTQAFITALSHEIEKYVGTSHCQAAREEFKSQAQGHVFAQWAVNFLGMPK